MQRLLCLFIMQYLKDEFLPYLQKWKEGVTSRSGFKEEEKNSQTTLAGIQISGITMLNDTLKHVVNSFLELVPIILKIPGVSFFLSDKLNQDPLEKYFGSLRQRGSVNTNPTIMEAMKSTQALRVVNTVRMDSRIKGNCRGRSAKRFSYDEIDLLPLPKRRHLKYD